MRYLPLLVLLAGCAGSLDSPVEPAIQSIGTFVDPTFLTAPTGDSTRVLVTERAGRVRLLKSGALQNGSFLDLRGKISAADEDGLYSLAFHPQYQTNGRFYAFYTNL
ncbi:MAG TPA: PQQ-dependent sugar dehydrogenase, partial [Gemmatimonadales bacterium]|nr:PQQ-dependent sugar dehydrogenase [Gemmatimonadales bacterium]